MLAENYGRRIIYTDYDRVTEDNVLKILRDAKIVHNINANRCDFLLNYESGLQPLTREKTFRPDINIECVDNVANEITEFKLAFVWNNAITLTQRGVNDNGGSKEGKAIALLNECYDAEEIRKKTQTLARFVEICGVGYEYIDINSEWTDGESYFNIEPLDPRYTFLVRSSRVGHKPILGVTFRQDALGNTFYTCFSKDKRWEVINLVKIIDPNGKEKILEKELWQHDDGSGVSNPLGIIPIVECIRSSDRMGCFERQIPEMDNLNLLISDFSNDVDQNTQAVWVTIDVDFPKDPETNEEITPRSGDWLRTYSTKDGKKPSVNPLANAYDYPGILQNIVTRRALILQKCNVPSRNDNSGGSTGVAMSDATGWSSAEASACREEAFISAYKMDELKVVLKAIKNNPNVEKDNPILELRPIDITPSIKRQKTYEMTTKINALCTAIDHGIDYKSMIKEINYFSDAQQVIEDSKDTMERYLDKLFGSESNETENAKTIVSADDPINQINNSPNIDGMATNQGDNEV